MQKKYLFFCLRKLHKIFECLSKLDNCYISAKKIYIKIFYIKTSINICFNRNLAGKSLNS